jgi:Putative auto-transporter adhesin, head GIN domain
MKKISMLFIALAVTLMANAQINGDKNIITKTFPLEKIEKLDINYGAKVLIDCKGTSEISITTDSNVMDYLSREVDKGKLTIDQKKWIEPSQQMVIRIGAPALRKLIFDSHGNFVLTNLETERFEIEAGVGYLTISGEVQELSIENDKAQIDASGLKADNAYIKITGRGKVLTQVVNQLKTDIAESGKLQVVNKPKELLGDANNAITKTTEQEEVNKDIPFFTFKLKNNSWNRHQYMVVGPKPDGTTFSYGFPMNPGQVKEKYWTNGTKLYKINSLGIRKLVLTIEKEDEGKLVEIYQ